MSYYCPKCEKIVPDTEVKQLIEGGIKKHIYTITKNAYGNQPKGKIGCLPIEETIYCGEVREPTEIEFFIDSLSK